LEIAVIDYAIMECNDKCASPGIVRIAALSINAQIHIEFAISFLVNHAVSIVILVFVSFVDG